MLPKDEDRMANNIGPDQTASSVAVKPAYTLCPEADLCLNTVSTSYHLSSKTLENLPS